MSDGEDLSEMPVSGGIDAAKRWGTALAEKSRSLVGQPFQSLPSRIVFSVFSAALVTSLAVAWMSTQSIESFLRGKIDEKFPQVLRGAAERLDLWYAQRELDVQTFARSSIMLENARLLSAGVPGHEEVRAREELTKYLTYVLERFPQYDALFLLDADGGFLLRVGGSFDLPPGLRGRLAGLGDSRVGDIRRLGSRRIQVASSPVLDSGGQAVASFHALLKVDEIEGVLHSDELGETGGVFLVGRQGESLTRAPGVPPSSRFARSLPRVDSELLVEDYENGAGVHVVGCAMRFARFGWTIAVEESYEAAFAPVVTVIGRILVINLCIVAIFCVIAFQMARSVVRPIRALSAGARRIAEGESGVVIAGSERADEIGVLTRVFNEMTAQLGAQYDQLQRANEVLEQLSITDGLTKLHNHRFFQDHLPQEMKRSLRTGEPLALILIDIDDFKKLNDKHGHAMGDAILRRVAERMNDAVREMDLLARYGGEEFALLAAQTGVEGAVALAEKVRTSVSERPFSIVELDGPSEISVTVSIGVAVFRGDEKALFNDADRALYRAKASGKDCVVSADDL
jgi:diguanylate cyclase (GGDEF)-like protein